MKRHVTIFVGLLLGWILPALSQPVPRWLPLEEVLKKWEGQPIEAIEKAAEKGEPTACHYLGYAYSEGLHGSPDATKAISWYERGIALNYLPSANNLGLLYFRGKLVPRDINKALRCFRLAGEKGFPNAQAMLGFIYEEGNGVAKDDGEALKWLRKAAEQGHARAMVHIGRHYRFGEGVPNDLNEANKWFRLAADKGEPSGALNLGWVYAYEQGNETEALKYYRDAAKQDSSEAMFELYLSYWNGKGVGKDRDEAKKWLTQAAEAGLPKAQYRLGDLYELDTTTWRAHLVEALHWYQKAAEQNWPGGQLRLAEFYLKGQAVEQDEERALELVRLAADQEYKPAMRELAELYARGIGIPRGRDDQPLQLLKRVTQLEKPNEQSSSRWAYQGIVRNYQYGIGTQKDLITAAQWYCRGTANGRWFFSLDEAVKNRPRAARGMVMTSTPDQRGMISLILPEEESREFCLVLRDYVRVARAKDGSVALQFGERYLAGQGAPADSLKAWCWFKVAAARGAPGVDARISAADASLSDEQKIQAKGALAELTKDLQNLLSAGLHGGSEQP